MNEIVNDWMKINNTWQQVADTAARVMDQLEMVAINMNVITTQLMGKNYEMSSLAAEPAIASIRNKPLPNIATKSQDGSITDVADDVRDEDRDDKMEPLKNAVKGTFKTVTKSAIKSLVKGGKKHFWKLFKKDVISGLADVAGDFIVEEGASLLAGFGAEIGIAGILETVGMVAAPEFVIPAMVAAHVIKKTFFDEPKGARVATSIQPAFKPYDKKEYTTMLQGMIDRGEAEMGDNYYSKDGKIRRIKSTVKDFSEGKPTNIAFRDEGALRVFKTFYDPHNIETGWHYDSQLERKPIKTKPIPYVDIMKDSFLRGMEKEYLSRGGRKDGTIDREIADMKKLVGNGPYKIFFDDILKKFNAFRKDVNTPAPKTQQYQAQGSTTYRQQRIESNTGRTVTININKPFIEHFIINAKEIREGYDGLKQKVEQILLEILNSVGAVN